MNHLGGVGLEIKSESMRAGVCAYLALFADRVQEVIGFPLVGHDIVPNRKVGLVRVVCPSLRWSSSRYQMWDGKANDTEDLDVHDECASCKECPSSEFDG